MVEEYDSVLELYKESVRLFRDVTDIEAVSLQNACNYGVVIVRIVEKEQTSYSMQLDIAF